MIIQFIKEISTITDSSLHCGAGSIVGNVFNKNEGDIVLRKPTLLVLMSQDDYTVLSVKSSDRSGAFLFSGIDVRKNTFMIMSHDYKREYNGVIADNIGGQNVDG